MRPPLIPDSKSTCPESQREDDNRQGIAPLRGRRTLAMLTALLIGVLVWFFWPSKPDLAGFDPTELGCLEGDMWRDYYQQDWMALSGHAWQVARRQYKFSRWDSLRLAWHSVQAARAFRQDTLNELAVADMTDYYRIVSQAAPPTFAADQAARLEVQWWRQRRADAPPDDWGWTIAQLTAAIYGCSAEEVLPAAQARVAAMVYRDARRTTGLREDEWREVSRQLVNAYALLKRTIENAPRPRAWFPGANPHPVRRTDCDDPVDASPKCAVAAHTIDRFAFMGECPGYFGPSVCQRADNERRFLFPATKSSSLIFVACVPISG